MRPHSKTFTQPTLAQQHSKDEVDINNIMARYIKTGVIDHVARYQPQYTENTMQDYHESLNIIHKANAMFSDLPSAVRKQFDNDPAKFMDFVHNPDNHSKLREMGLTETPMSPPSDNPEQPSPLSVNEPDPPPSEPATAADEPE